VVVHDRLQKAFSLFPVRISTDMTNRRSGLAIYLQQPPSRDAECCSLFDLVCHIMSTSQEVVLHDIWGDLGWAEYAAQP
jgi:hypothetical protein